MISGIVPSMIYYGIQILSPDIFLLASCIICIIVSLATGSSWTTSATIGIALMGVGKSLGVDDGFIAGAILSGAYFGDKMSPLSDTTNLAPAVSGTTLFKHIRYLSYTTIPSIIISLLAPSEPDAPGVYKVSVASLVALSLIVPLFAERESVAL